jgi:hypothetical protein
MSDTDIPEQAEEAIKQLSSRHNKGEPELREQYTDLVDEEREKGVSNPKERALRRLSLEYKGSSMAEEEMVRGYVFGVSDPINTTNSAINRAKNYIEKRGPQAAVKQGLVKRVPSGDLPSELASISVTQDGETEVYAVLDPNDNSPTSGEVLPAEDYIRYAYGVVWRAPDDGPHLFSGVINGEDPSDVPKIPPKGEPVKFEAVWVGESDQNNTIRLRFRGSDPFEVDDQFDGPGLMDLFEDDDLLGFTPLDEADSDNFDRNDVVVTHGAVDYMELSPDGDQSRRLSVLDPFAFDSDLTRTVWMPEHTTVDFAEDSDVYVIGQVSPSNNEYPDSIDAVGVIPDPQYKIDRPDTESMGDDGDEQEEEVAGVDTEVVADDEPDEDHDAEFETGATIEDSEQAEKAEDGEHLPDAVKEALYPELQAVAADVDEVPGSGIGADEMRHQLADALGPGVLAERLADDETGQGQDADGDTETDDDEDVVDDDTGDFEPTDEDEEWSW